MINEESKDALDKTLSFFNNYFKWVCWFKTLGAFCCKTWKKTIIMRLISLNYKECHIFMLQMII